MAGAEVGFVAVDRGTRVVAIDDGTVYAVDGSTTVSWRVGDQDVARVEGGLRDVAAGVELSSGEMGSFVIPTGQPGRLSPDGALAITWIPGESFVSVVAPTMSSYAPPALDLDARSVVLDARFTPSGDVVLVTSRVYLLSMGQDDVTGSSGRSPFADLVTCSVADGSCTTDVGRDAFAGDSSNPNPIILAR